MKGLFPTETFKPSDNLNPWSGFPTRPGGLKSRRTWSCAFPSPPLSSEF